MPTQRQWDEWLESLEDKTDEELQYVFETEYLHHWQRRIAKAELDRRILEAADNAVHPPDDRAPAGNDADDGEAPAKAHPEPDAVPTPHRATRSPPWPAIVLLLVILLVALDLIAALSFRSYDGAIMGTLNALGL